MRQNKLQQSGLNRFLRLYYPAILGAWVFSTTAIAAQAAPEPTNLSVSSEPSGEVAEVPQPPMLDKVVELGNESMAQVTDVNQLQDVSPGDWAYEALRGLVERYGCIEGYPDRTFRGTRALTRYEFAAGLYSCLVQIERLIAGSSSFSNEDLATLQRLAAEFESELGTLGARVDNLEGRVAFLEDTQFSTTTKLAGEVAFTIAQAFGEDVDDAQVVFNDRVRLQLATTFTGEDILFTRLTAGNVGNTFQDQLPGNTLEGRFAFDGQADNNVTIDRLHYYFPVGTNLRIFTFASLGGHHFYADTFNPGLEAGGGATGSLSRFGERNPIYRQGLGGQGFAFTYNLGDIFTLSGGYLARGGFLPDAEAGLFNGNYSALGQLVIEPSDRFKVGFTYLNSYDINAFEEPRPFAFGATGTSLGNLNVGDLGVPNRSVVSNSYGIEGQFDISPKVSIRAWGGFTDAKLIGLGSADIWTYALVLAFPDLIKEGNFGAIIFGAEPYLTELDVPDDPDFEDDIPFHIEALYKYYLSENILITPGVIVLTAPNQNADNDPAIIGALRTTFTF